MTDVQWRQLLDVLHPDAAVDVRALVSRGELDPENERQAMDAAIEAHARRTGVTLNFRF